MSGFSLLLGFISTLIATLTGVVFGFWNNRQEDLISRYTRSIQHLNSVKQELTRNKMAIDQNIDVIEHLQNEGGGEAIHYTVSCLSRDSWEAALEDSIIQDLNEEAYKDLNEIYYRILIVNQLIERLQAESVHPMLGEIKEESMFDEEMWTMSVTYWNEEAGEIREGDLATVIKTECNQIGIRIEDMKSEVRSAIEELQDQKEDTKNRSLKRWL